MIVQHVHGHRKMYTEWSLEESRFVLSAMHKRKGRMCWPKACAEVAHEANAKYHSGNVVRTQTGIHQRVQYVLFTL